MTQFQHKTEFQHKIEFQHDLNKNNNGAPPVSVVLQYLVDQQQQQQSYQLIVVVVPYQYQYYTTSTAQLMRQRCGRHNLCLPHLYQQRVVNTSYQQYQLPGTTSVQYQQQAGLNFNMTQSISTGFQQISTRFNKFQHDSQPGLYFNTGFLELLFNRLV